MSMEVLAQHIRCVHLLQGLCFKVKETGFPFPLVGSGPSPAEVFIHLMSPPPGVQGLESIL